MCYFKINYKMLKTKSCYLPSGLGCVWTLDFHVVFLHLCYLLIHASHMAIKQSSIFLDPFLN